MSAAKKAIRCASCKKRIREHQEDLEVVEISTGRRRYYHAWCGEAAYTAAREQGGAWLATHRYVDADLN